MMFIIGNSKFSKQDQKRSNALLKTWNDTVGAGDMVIHIGKFAEDNAEYYTNSLNGLIVFVAGSKEAGVAGPTFRNLFLYDDLTFSQRKLPKKEVLCLLNISAAELTDTDIPEIVGKADSSWTHKYAGQRIVGHNYIYLLQKTVINVDCELWERKPVSITKLLQGLAHG